jgi:hypothetical protein
VAEKLGGTKFTHKTSWQTARGTAN